jgi:repressor LexA
MIVPSDFNSLTSKQKKIYAAIETFIKENGIPPTVREIGDLVGEKTPGAVQGILNRLQQKGVIKREIGMARSIKLVSENSQYATPAFIPEVKKISRRNVGDLFRLNIMYSMPLVIP